MRCGCCHWMHNRTVTVSAAARLTAALLSLLSLLLRLSMALIHQTPPLLSSSITAMSTSSNSSAAAAAPAQPSSVFAAAAPAGGRFTSRSATQWSEQQHTECKAANSEMEAWTMLCCARIATMSLIRTCCPRGGSAVHGHRCRCRRDRCLENGAIKTAYGIVIGGLASIVLFRQHTGTMHGDVTPVVAGARCALD